MLHYYQCGYVIIAYNNYNTNKNELKQICNRKFSDQKMYFYYNYYNTTILQSFFTSYKKVYIKYINSLASKWFYMTLTVLF